MKRYELLEEDTCCQFQYPNGLASAIATMVTVLIIQRAYALIPDMRFMCGHMV